MAKLDEENPSSRAYEISRTLIHPSYNTYCGVAVKDVGLIKLAKAIEFIDNTVEPACLDLDASFTESVSVEAFLVSGWDNAFDMKEHTNELGIESFAGVRGCVEGLVECQNYIYATKLWPDSLFGEKGNDSLGFS